ncbi:hypothetical protein HKBW3C_02322 [Candidatus Hakubella thermalkaliphila]|nr:hypothetical protein HKBW3C_02322 [Candidatus Hakubella thermalkaliphila]
MRMPSRLLALPEISFQAFEPLAPKLPPTPRPQAERILKTGSGPAKDPPRAKGAGSEASPREDLAPFGGGRDQGL